jgi:hypothetical protein
MRAIALRGAACAVVALALSCRPTDLDESWTCDFDATEGRPLDDPDAPTDDAGSLPADHCMNTCGPPVTSCKRIVLDADIPGALCPVCTF